MQFADGNSGFRCDKDQHSHVTISEIDIENRGIRSDLRYQVHEWGLQLLCPGIFCYGICAWCVARGVRRLDDMQCIGCVEGDFTSGRWDRVEQTLLYLH
jgi:hypothetical protein